MPGVILDDAPCGVAEASPVEFNDGGTPAVEVGDRQGALYGLNLQTGDAAPGMGQRLGQRPSARDRAATTNPAGGTPATGVIGVGVPGRLPVDSTASVGSGNLYFGAGNAARPGRRRLLRLRRRTGQWPGTRSSHNPASDAAPDGGVQASLPLAEGGSLVEGGSLGQKTYGLNSANGVARTGGWPQFSADSVFSTAAVGDLYGTGSDEFVVGGRRRRASPTARTTPTAATSGSTTTTAG